MTFSVNTFWDGFRRAGSFLAAAAKAEEEERNGNVKAAKAVYEQLAGDAATRCPLAHIQLMRFLRRTEGMEAARKAFLAARKARECSFHVYVASAYMELCHNKESKVARNVFQLGMKKFGSEPGFVREFARFLSRLNDGQAMRELLQGALTSPSLPPHSALMLWEELVECEQLFGDLTSLIKAQEGRRKALASVASPGGAAEPEVEVWREQQDLVDRFSYCGLLPCDPSALPPNLEAGSAGPAPPAVSSLSAALAAAAAVLMPRGAAGAGGAAGAATEAGGEGNVKEEATSRRVKEEAEGGERPGAAVGADGNTAGAGGAKEGGEKGGVEKGEQQREGASGAAGVKTHQFVASAAVEWKPGPYPDVDFIMSLVIQAELPPEALAAKSGGLHRNAPPGMAPGAPGPGGGTGGAMPLAGSKRKEQEEEEMANAEARARKPPPVRDIFRLRQLQRARAGSSGTGSLSGGAGGTGGGTASGSDRFSGGSM
ncbi:unnamed protein product [Closterium sp. Naga37s-1]|nr:unnamed protein product [Closterium sp. Naga37s-1]